MQIGIVADDLTGAADSLAPFARRGLTAAVGFVSQDRPQFRLAEGDALAYNTETRDLPIRSEQRIALTLRAAARHLQEQKPKLLYKKIDSTLRGHLRLELEALRRELPGRLPIVCPAFPAAGRIVQRGRLYVHGVPLFATEYALTSAGSSAPTVGAAFAFAQDQDAAELFLDDLRQGAQTLDQQLQRLWARRAPAVFCDATTPEDLRLLALAILRWPERYLPVGSAGLAAALADTLGGAESVPNPASGTIETVFHARRVLVVVGSRNPASRRQATYLTERAGVLPIVVTDDCNSNATARQILTAFAAGERLVLLTTAETPLSQGGAKRLGRLARALHKLWLEGAARRDTRRPFDALVATGGETALALCRSFHAIGLRIAGETQPGVVCGTLYTDTLSSNPFDGLPLITKAGGFGDEGTLARCVGLK